MSQFVETEREVLGELLESLVDVPDVEIDGRRYHRVLDSTLRYHGGGVSEGQAHAVPPCP